MTVLGLSFGCNTLIDLEAGALRETSGAGGASSTSSSGASATCTEGSGGAGGISACGDRAWAHWKSPESRIYIVNDDTVADSMTGLMWQRTAPSGRFTWQAAIEYCDALVLSGYCDWRLPKRIELVSIVNYTNWNPSIDEALFPDSPIGWFWSSSPQKFHAKNMFEVSFVSGEVYVKDMTTEEFARCVRGGGHP